MIDTKYDPSESERRIYNTWESEGFFKPTGVGDERFSIVMPPPNVTGSLHMGHALNTTLQDILVRYQRMKGRDVLWQPGTDHAGIATQMVVERNLAAEGNADRQSLGRETFIEEIWKWKEKSGGTITKQLRRLGASCDWSRERFTMDEGLSEAVVKVFVDLYNDGLIYKDKRLVNWDPALKTAISDLEVIQKEMDGHLWYIRYNFEEDSKNSITIATTRPETMFGDTAIAVHPKDKRYKKLIGKKIVIPIVNRAIPIIEDEYADPDQGSGAVKITPAHDFNDFEVGKRNNLEMISILDTNGALNENTPKDWQGIDRFEARELLLKQLEEKGYLVKAEPYLNSVPHGDRSDVIIEPYLTDQWYVDAKTLAKPAIENVENGETKFIPENWSKTYFDWMNNIQPWCISRQLWWGHRIPAWYTDKGEVIVAKSEAEAKIIAKEKYSTDKISRDEDVLDTWFSSALWPFSTLDWPNDTNDLDRFYPTSLLITGFDIIFFWVARMMMMGLYFQKKIPFSEVYIHALVRDENGQKMSKSKGNVVDPLELIDQYGADSLRFTLASMASFGRDIKLSKSRVEGYRNFGTKLWNASRFCEINNCSKYQKIDLENLKCILTNWILGEIIKTDKKINLYLDEYKFNEASNEIYHFIWHIFCDWYLELIKPYFDSSDSEHLDEIKAVTAFSLKFILTKLHPFMPFITEELWENLGYKEKPLILSEWDLNLPEKEDVKLSLNTNFIINIISSIRSIRSELNIASKTNLSLEVMEKDYKKLSKIQDIKLLLNRLVRVDDLIKVSNFSDRAASFSVSEIDFALVIDDSIDLSMELLRIEKEEEKIFQDINSLKKKLDNKNFVEKAPKEVVQENIDRLDDLSSSLTKVKESKLFIGKFVSNGE
ncbi:MAG: valine--tRNA ligase [Alphaproteobacteria bacterium]|nr:MAG: valine--tRNA ligase [alpha proteobacterium MED-G09]|tara:strand:+ start:1514 stop:4171 length:2658 start_codon:yes stop_codon:yes gene_type:complete